MSVYCKGKCCTDYEIIRDGRAFYSNGGKYCRTCSRYMKLDSVRCPCCKQKVSSKTRRPKMSIRNHWRDKLSVC